ncbi:glycine oxidase ThiO [Coxiella burnetii]|uniref:glycine oxidase ThiO n=1 Tax=Coxiella burnetii TaxID=777 RepID=UPI00016314FF|nr:glycine oxidase ThiO [Coxiella burnetii]ACJ19806.1 glycine oxidase [Coxiella burnetii CbuK_Q154]AIT62823.1 Glycine oxidase ThiO [Coxiella burnetii str. Namibia]ATN85639.1 glycine oxidase [Coxiella burnetii str. Schperling]EAX32369.2 glycine oxidase ThiO [Coxiella burnetii 'MSU Goat Q177']EDR35382.1 glycine oxidase ThiO [Coxiella burnetii Q321]
MKMKVGIAGAGLLGRLLAWQLSKVGFGVTLFDKDDKSGQKSTAYAAAGMLSPVAECEIAEQIIFNLGSYSLRKWPLWLSSLNQPVYFKQNGSIVISHSHDEVEKERWLKQISRKIKDFSLEKLSSSALQRLEPELNFDEGYYLPQEAHLDSRALMQTLEKELNVEWHSKTFVESVVPYRILTKGKSYQFDCIFDCRGTGAGEMFSDLRSVRGELIYLHAPEVRLNRPIRLLHPRYRLYIVPRAHHIYLIGASEIESNDISQISVRTCLELLSAVYSVHPAFAEARIIETVTALRPALSDNLPRIHYQPGLIAINGLYRHGFLVAPALIDEVIHNLSRGIK